MFVNNLFIKILGDNNCLTSAIMVLIFFNFYIYSTLVDVISYMNCSSIWRYAFEVIMVVGVHSGFGSIFVF